MKEFIKSKKQKIIIQNKEFKGREYVDIRLYFLSDEDDYKPSTKGITIPLDKYEEFQNCIREHDINSPIYNKQKNTSSKNEEFGVSLSDRLEKSKQLKKEKKLSPKQSILKKLKAKLK